MGIGWQLGLVAALLVLNALLAGSEVALISLREAQLLRLERRGARGRAVARLARDPNSFLATIQIGITLSGFLASATAAVSLAEPLVAPLGALGDVAEPVAVVLVTVVLTFVTLVIGELAPKRVAMQRAEGWALASAGPLLVLARITGPLVRFLGAATDLSVRLLGADPARGRDAPTEEEVRDLIATGGLYDPDERRIITGALQAADRVLRQVLRPRRSVVALAADLPAAEGLRRLIENGHSRAPVYATTLDDADRLVGVMDLVGRDGTVGERSRPIVALPESLGVIEALRSLQEARLSLAVVVDEYGGVAGIVTVEDLVEELVGEIHDEFDRDVREAVRSPDGSVAVVGHFPLHDLVDLGLELDTEDLDAVTVAGLVTEVLGAIPSVGDRVEVDDHELVVESANTRAAERVRIRRTEHGRGRATATPRDVVDPSESTDGDPGGATDAR